ncbi:MAG: TonB-dependent receptor [Bacteroidales bacterium]
MKKILQLISLLLILQCQSAYAQSITVTGNVISAEDYYPLIGVNVVVKNGDGVGTITDFDGNFTINVEKGSTLAFSYIGYTPIERKITSETPLEITLESNAIVLNEVVAVGYGTMKKSDLTGAVTSVKASDLQKTPAAGLDQALQGRAAGVTVNANSGQPGAAAEVRIRGIGTVNDSSPIYVVDGVIVSDIMFLNPSDIESTEILKDASSTAIYGSRGANGVILVTTKKGSNTGKANITFNGYVGVQNAWKQLDLMGAQEFAATIVSMKGLASEVSYYENNGFNAWLSAYRLGSSDYYPTNLDYSQIDTNWQDEIFVDNAMIQSYSLSVDGGNETSNYSISGSYFTQDGTIIGSDYERFTLRANSSHKVRDWLKIGENLSFMRSSGTEAMNNNASPGASIISAAIAMAPWDPTHYPEGSVNGSGDDLSGQISAASNFKNTTNPFSMVESSHPSSITERWVGDIYLEISPIKDLLIRSDVSLDLNNYRYSLYKDAYDYSSYDQSSTNFISSSMSRYATWIVENTISYNKEWGDHSISAMLGNTVEEYNYYSIGGSGSTILNPEEYNWLLSQATEDQSYASDDIDRSRMLSFLGRVHYTYKNKYMITTNFRADGSDKFPENIWGYFPSTSLAWKISDEEFMKGIDCLNFLKVRAGWGQIGNDKIGNDSFTLTVFNSGPTFTDYVLGTTQDLATGATVLTYVNNGGKWETTEQINVGIDFGLFGNKFTGTLDLYQRDTKDMLLSVTAPAHVGNRYAALANVGTVSNKGVELSLTYQSSVADLNYNITGNVAFVDNELTELNGGSVVYGDKTICDEGLSLYSFYGYEYAGIYQSDAEALEYLDGYTADDIPYHAGDAIYVDQNGDGIIDDDDKTVIGDQYPSITYGLNIGADWRGFDVQIFFQGVYGNEIFNALRQRTEWDGTESTLSTTMRDVWTTTNTDGTIPNPYGTSNNNWDSSRFIEDGSYLRLKNVQIGYTIPRNVIRKAGLQGCRVYLSGSNLLTFTNYTGYDPEVGGGVDYGNYPQSRTFMLGTTINF